MKNKYLQVRITTELREAFKKKCNDRHEDMADVIRRFMWEYIEKGDKVNE